MVYSVFGGRYFILIVDDLLRMNSPVNRESSLDLALPSTFSSRVASGSLAERIGTS